MERVATRLAWLVAAAAGAILLSLSASAPAATMSIDDVEDVFAKQLESSHVPGGAYAIVKDDAIEAGGLGDIGTGEAAGRTPFVIGSTTKSITALAVMQLVDSGDVTLETPVRDYVPEFTLAGSSHHLG